MNLYINACVRAGSRTEMLADHLLKKLEGPTCELRLGDMVFPVADEEFLRRRDGFIASGDFDDPMFAPAKQFAKADRIVIAAPFWDLSFPAAVKQYFEQINVSGLTFEYTAEGYPRGLCSAKSLYYVTTAGGCFFPQEYGFGYVATLAGSFYGIQDVRLIKALGLDIEGADVEAILSQAMGEIDDMFSK